LKDWDDSAGWEDFFQTYCRLIYGYAVKSGLSDATAQDVVQESIITVSKNVAKYDPAKSSFKGWLYMIVSSRIVDRLRKHQRSLKCIPLQNDLGGQRPGLNPSAANGVNAFEDIWEKEWQNALLQIATEKVKKRVNPRQFQMFDLLVSKEWPSADVQKMMGVSESAVRKAKDRIIDLIEKEVKQLENHPPVGI